MSSALDSLSPLLIAAIQHATYGPPMVPGPRDMGLSAPQSSGNDLTQGSGDGPSVGSTLLPNRADYGNLDFTPVTPHLTPPDAAYGGSRLMRALAAVRPTDPTVAPNGPLAFLLGALGGAGTGARQVVSDRQAAINQQNAEAQKAADQQNQFGEQSALQGSRQYTNDLMSAKEKMAGQTIITKAMIDASNGAIPDYMEGKMVPNTSAMVAGAKGEKDELQPIAKGSSLYNDLADFMSKDQKDRAASSGLHQSEIRNLYEQAAAHNKLQPSGDDAATTLTPEAKKFWARYVAQTGQLPPLGMGQKAVGLRSELLNQAAVEAGGTDVASNKAAYGADVGSLKTLQNNLDQVTAYESTARDNANTLRKYMKNLPDSGNKYLNGPLRDFMSKMGSDDVQGFETALGTVRPEFTRILQSGGSLAGGGSLTDAAQKDMKATFDGTGTVNQLLTSLDVLAKDAGNRRKNYAAQVATVKSRIGSALPNGSHPLDQFVRP